MKIDYSLLKKDVETAKKVIEKQAKDHYPGVLETVRKLIGDLLESLGELI